MTIAGLLADAGYAAARHTPLPGDAGTRHYVRLHGGPRPALLVLHDGPGDEAARFARLARHLRAHDLSAPEVLAEAPGALLVEDFGPTTLADALDAGADPAAAYAAAAATLAALHAVPPPPGLPAWDAAALHAAAAATFLDWWWPAAFGAQAAPAIRAAFADAVAETLAPFAEPAGFVHRDYFPANLIPLPDRPGARAVGLLDFQDAALGHPAYDLVSLIEDARRDVPPSARRAAITAYLAAIPGDPVVLLGAAAAFGAVRHLRVAALWVRLARRDGKPAYLVHGPRCWRLLDRALSQPATRPLRRFLDAHVPATHRANPPGALAPPLPVEAR